MPLDASRAPRVDGGGRAVSYLCVRCTERFCSCIGADTLPICGPCWIPSPRAIASRSYNLASGAARHVSAMGG